MKKNDPNRNPGRQEKSSRTALPPLKQARSLPQVLDFPYKKFARLVTIMPFSQKEWAAILHLSEKTLQRYAKENKSFEGIYVDRILQVQEIIDLGLEAFTSAELFYQWLKKDKPVLGSILNFDSLKSTQGIGLIRDELGRIIHGVYI